MEDWSREKTIEEAEREPERLEFWRQYHPDYLEACRAVVDNPPWFDEMWKQEFPDPAAFRRHSEREGGQDRG